MFSREQQKSVCCSKGERSFLYLHLRSSPCRGSGGTAGTVPCTGFRPRCRPRMWRMQTALVDAGATEQVKPLARVTAPASACRDAVQRGARAAGAVEGARTDLAVVLQCLPRPALVPERKDGQLRTRTLEARRGRNCWSSCPLNFVYPKLAFFPCPFDLD